jgi:carboxymethylenebutenolidase
VSETAAQGIGALFEAHMQAEIEGDLDRTMATMSSVPHLNHVSVRAGGYGYDEVRAFYGEHLVPCFFGEDSVFELLSRTANDERLVDEMIITFTHDKQMDFFLPGVAATGRRVSLPVVVIVGVAEGKVSYEHIYWDQASLLVQIGLLDPTGLPVTGADQAEQLRNPTLPYRTDY